MFDPPEQLIGYGPTPLETVAVVMHDTPAEAVAAESPFIIPVVVKVNAGFADPYALNRLFPVTDSGATFTAKVPVA